MLDTFVNAFGHLLRESGLQVCLPKAKPQSLPAGARLPRRQRDGPGQHCVPRQQAGDARLSAKEGLWSRSHDATAIASARGTGVTILRSMAGVDYDRLGKGYAAIRRPDPRVAALIQRALGDAGSVVNVGAGTGSYEPTDRRVVAVEPSAVMLRQRPRMSAPAVQAVAEALPFRDRSFDASMGIFTVHHWADQTEGLAELQRVARRRIVIVTSDPEIEQFFWLNEFYFPALTRLDRDRVMGPEALLDRLGPGKVIPVPVPHDCEDGFCSAYWRRPEAYLDPKVRAGISYFARCHARPWQTVRRISA